MIGSRVGLAAGLLAGLFAVAGCQPRYICDVGIYADDAQCGPIVLGCSMTPNDFSQRLDLASAFSLQAPALRAQELQAAPLALTVRLDYLDDARGLTTGKLTAEMLAPTSDGELRMQLGNENLMGLAHRRGGAANVSITLGRWHGVLDAATQQRGCSFVIEPRFSAGAGKLDAPHPGLSQPGAQLFVGKRIDCMATNDVCNRSSALYASFVGPDGGSPHLQLTRFTLNAKGDQLIEDPALSASFQNDVSSAIRPSTAAVVATGSQLVLDPFSANLMTMPAADLNSQTQVNVPLHKGIQGFYDAERVYLGRVDVKNDGNSEVAVSDLSSSAGMWISSILTQPYRVFGRAPRWWSSAAGPEVLLLSDQRDLRFLGSLTPDFPDTLASTALSALSENAADLEPLLADLDADGLFDLVILDHKSKKLSWLPRLRDGSFASLRPLDDSLPSVASFAVADFNGDGLPDLAILAASLPAGSPDLSVYLNVALPAPK